MSDKYTLGLKNFRSIRDAEIDIAPLTVVYGPNGSGKSSIIYGLLTLKNFLTEPSRNLPGLLSYPGISLGGFDEVVFNHLGDESVEVSLSVSTPDRGLMQYTLGATKSGGKSSIYVRELSLADGFSSTLDVPFPYQMEQSTNVQPSIRWEGDGLEFDPGVTFGWNGIHLYTFHFGEVGERLTRATEILNWANSRIGLAREAYFVPLRRGFMYPMYALSNVTPMLSTDAEVVSLLATDRYLGYKVSDYMEMVSDRQLHARAQIGTSSFTLDSVPRNRDETPVSIVNEGFGVNQLAYMLTVALYDKAKIVLIEEPEIHLHPSMVRKLVHAFVDIVSNSDRRFVISTHSETFVVALLAQIAAGKINVDDVSFLLAQKENGQSKFTKQEAKPNGQIQGGLDSFIAAELEDMAAFLGVDPEEDLD